MENQINAATVDFETNYAMFVQRWQEWKAKMILEADDNSDKPDSLTPPPMLRVKKWNTVSIDHPSRYSGFRREWLSALEWGFKCISVEDKFRAVEKEDCIHIQEMVGYEINPDLANLLFHWHLKGGFPEEFTTHLEEIMRTVP